MATRQGAGDEGERLAAVALAGQALGFPSSPQRASYRASYPDPPNRLRIPVNTASNMASVSRPVLVL